METRKTTQKTATRHRLAGLLFAFGVAALFLLGAPPAARACYWPCDVETNAMQIQILEDYDMNSASQKDTRKKVNKNTDDNFKDLEDWLVNTVFLKKLLPAFMMMTEQISITGIHQMEAIGMFLDAKHQLETQRLFQLMTVQTREDYQPSEGLCTIGTMTRSLGGTERNVKLTAFALSRRSLARELGQANSVGGGGKLSDRMSRYENFRARYCDKKDDAKYLDPICQHDASVPTDEINKDIDFYRTVGEPMNLSLDFSSTTATDDEKDVLALQANLYANQVPATVSAGGLQFSSAIAQSYMTQRAITAKRAVAANSFQAIAAMKAVGQTSVALTAQYMQAALEEMGISSADAQKLIGKNPSYYTQMDLLTKKIFQRPEFFVDLVDKPVNIERKSVALRAISNMQKRDIFESALRTEMMLSILLEMDVSEDQSAVQDEMDRLR